MTGIIRAMTNLFRRYSPPPADPRPCECKPITPERAALMKELEAAKETNNKAAMGVVLTSVRTAKNESSVQAMLHGMLGQLDRGKH